VGYARSTVWVETWTYQAVKLVCNGQSIHLDLLWLIFKRTTRRYSLSSESIVSIFPVKLGRDARLGSTNILPWIGDFDISVADYPSSISNQTFCFEGLDQQVLLLTRHHVRPGSVGLFRRACEAVIFVPDLLNQRNYERQNISPLSLRRILGRRYCQV
jgi:hypothetical protein